MQRVLFALALAVLANPVQAAVIAQWTFETNTPPDATNTAVYPNSIAPEIGTGIAGGVHASAATDWTSPVGNGSLESFSSNNWGPNDYYQFQANVTGFKDLIVSFDQVRSTTGPNTFLFTYSDDGVAFIAVLPTYSPPDASWASGSTSLASHFTLNLSTLDFLDFTPTVYFRLYAVLTPESAAGTSGVDNFTVSGTSTAMVSAVPEPASLTLWSLGAIGSAIGAYRRRKRT